MRRLLLVLVGVAVPLLVACGGQDAPSADAAGSAAAAKHRTRSHVVTIVMENKESDEVVGSPEAPYTTKLARRYGLAVRSYGIRHPSLPNYIALTSGSTHGITSNCTDCSTGARSIVDQLAHAGLSWRAYMQGMPRRCYTGSSAGGYVKRHNPFMYYDRVVRNPQRCRNVVPYARLARDLRRHALPAYSFVVPDLCNDTHDCGVGRGDKFLSRAVPRLLRALGPRGFLVLTYDEGSSDAGCCGGANGGRIATIVAGPGVRRGARMHRPVDHYGVLRTVEDALRLPRLGEAADARHGSLRPLFKKAPRIR